MRSFGLNVFSEEFSQTNAVIRIELDQGKGIWGIIWLCMWHVNSSQVQNQRFSRGPAEGEPTDLSDYFIFFYYFMEEK